MVAVGVRVAVGVGVEVAVAVGVATAAYEITIVRDADNGLARKRDVRDGARRPVRCPPKTAWWPRCAATLVQVTAAPLSVTAVGFRAPHSLGQRIRIFHERLASGAGERARGGADRAP